MMSAFPLLTWLLGPVAIKVSAILEPSGGHQKKGIGRPKGLLSQAAAQVSLVWERFEAMEEAYLSASEQFWPTIWCLRRGKQCSTDTIYSGSGDLFHGGHCKTVEALQGSPHSHATCLP